MVTKNQVKDNDRFHFGVCKKGHKPVVCVACSPFQPVKRTGFYRQIRYLDLTATGGVVYSRIAHLPKVFSNKAMFHTAKSCRVHKNR